MKTSELQGMSDDELAMTLRDTERNLFHLRFQSATDRLETPSEVRKSKRLIARIKTLQRERELKKLVELPNGDLDKMLTDLHTRTELPGKRRVKRAIHRLQNIQASRGNTAVAGSGK